MERLVEVIHKRKDCRIECFYHPTKKLKNLKITNNFDDLLLCDAIIISSPNHTHCNYIKKLEQNYSGYIFCEKPPATSTLELKKLKNLKSKYKSKIFFNFNYRFSNFNKILSKNLKSQKLGKIVLVNIISNHGLSFKKGYSSSWRADGKNNLHNILETVSIHFLDLAISNFGSIVKSHNTSKLISNNGSSFDTSYLLLNHKNGVLTTILNSYATPLIEELMIIGTNGYLTIRKNKLIIHSPRNSFDKKGFFITPPISSSSNFDLKSDYNSSLKKSMDFFITHVKNKKTFPITNFRLSLDTNEILLKLEQNH